jgi:2-polyprenyl-6-methoxyphenol hydroxylase-like FAD-dependent oxidoreductase
VRQHYGCTVCALDQNIDRVTATLTDGTRWSGDLLIGADGIHSTVRRLAFGPDSIYLGYLGFHTAAYIFADPHIRRSLGDQFAITDTMDRAVGLYAIRNGRIAVFTVHRSRNPALRKDPRAALQATYSDLGWLIPDTLAHCPDPPALYYDQVSQVEMSYWTTGRIGLIGEAGYAVSLLAGQGASLAVAGAHLLASELATGADVTEALSSYQARMTPPVIQKTSRRSPHRRMVPARLPNPTTAPSPRPARHAPTRTRPYAEPTRRGNRRHPLTAPMVTVTMSPAWGPIPSGGAELPRRNRTPVSERNLIHDEARSRSGSAPSRQRRWFFASARSRLR